MREHELSTLFLGFGLVMKPASENINPHKRRNYSRLLCNLPYHPVSLDWVPSAPGKWATVTQVIPVVDVAGDALRIRDVIVTYLPDGSEMTHEIDHFAVYPGHYVGGHARRAFFDLTEQHGCTVADNESFHVRREPPC